MGRFLIVCLFFTCHSTSLVYVTKMCITVVHSIEHGCGWDMGTITQPINRYRLHDSYIMDRGIGKIMFNMFISELVKTFCHCIFKVTFPKTFRFASCEHRLFACQVLQIVLLYTRSPAKLKIF